MSGAGDGPVAAETPSQPALDENKHTPARSCSPMWRSFLEEPPLTTRKEALKRTPRLVKSCTRLTKTQPRTDRTMETLVMRYPSARVVSNVNGNECLSPKYSPSVPRRYFDQVFETVRELGHGSFGTVYCVKSVDDGKLYAVKCLQIPYKGDRDRADKLREVLFHERALPHDNILHLELSWEEWDQLYIQTELCEETLEDVIANSESVTPEYRVWDVLIDMLHALDHLHSMDVLHNDIKPENIFIDQEGVCKLGDFGMALDLAKDDLDVAGKEGDSQYLAAEVLMGVPTKATDVFSLGLTIFQLATDLCLPQGGTERWHDLRNLNIDAHLTSHLSEELKNLLFAMIDPDPAKRPSTAELLKSKAVESHSHYRGWTRFYHKWQHRVGRIFSPLADMVSKAGFAKGSTSAVVSRPAKDESSDFNKNVFDDEDDDYGLISAEDQEKMQALKLEWEQRNCIVTPPRSGPRTDPASARRRLASLKRRIVFDDDEAPARPDGSPTSPPCRLDHNPPTVEFD